MLSYKQEQGTVSMNVPRYEMAREKSKRPQLSCNSCRARKVKCDRLQPCSACSLHQISEQCQYDLTESERRPILQAEALRAKDREIAWLKEQIEHLGGSPLGSDPHHDRKKRKSGLSAGIRGTRSPSQRPSPTRLEQPQTPTRYAPVPQDPTVDRSYKRPKPSVKYISIPSPGESGPIATHGPASSPQQWNEAELDVSWPPELKRAFTHPDYHSCAGSKHTSAEIATTIKEEHSPCMPTANCSSGEQLVLAHHPRLWNTCFTTGSEALSVMPTCSGAPNGIDFLPYSSADSHGMLATTKHTSSSAAQHPAAIQPANCPYSIPSLPTPSSSSYPSSTYAHSTSGSSSLHTPSASHPVSPTLSQSQPFCMNQSQTQPPSPIWGFEAIANGGSHVSSGYEAGSGGHLHHGFVSGADNANSAALIAELAGSGDKEGGMGTWHWKMAWAN